MKWTLELATLGGPIEVTDEAGRVVAYINTSTRGVKDPKEAERIGRLVAEAPAMLNALRSVETVTEVGDNCDLEQARGHMRGLLVLTRHVLRRIDGEEPTR